MRPLGPPPTTHFRIPRLFRAVAPMTRKGTLAVLLVFCGMLLASCEPGSDLAPLPNATIGPYRLSVDDQVRIITLGEEQISGQFRVNDRGNIAIPLLGTVPADGLTTAELETRIVQSLKDKNVLIDPSVSVEVLGYRPVFILGQVTRPGQYPYQPGMTVLTAVAIAGGFTYRAQPDYASILRKIDGHPVEGRVPRGADVLPGDVITILDRYF
jgi:polysaccharide export outer membrane protein